MLKKKITLRLHIFIAFCLVFVISFSTIFVAFRLVIENYITKDATSKLQQTIQQAQNLAGSLKDSVFIVKGQSDYESKVSSIVQTISGINDVEAALLDSNLYLEWPKSSDSYRDRSKAVLVYQILQESGGELGDNKVYVVEIDGSPHYVSSVSISSQSSMSDETNMKYLLVYLDISPYVSFAKNFDQMLYVILASALLLAMLVSLLVSNSIVSSLHKLTDFAENIGSGIFEKREFNLIDKELDLLAANMNIMAYKLDRANIEQKTFFQNASHELRTPLMSIQGYAEGLKLSVFDDPDVALDIVISESKRLTSMVENLLAISRLDMVAYGMRSTIKSTLNIRKLIESVVEKVRGSFLLNNIELTTQIDLSDIYILGNENDLFRALENILSNAIRHCKSKIDLHIGLQDTTQVYIQVSDDGPGISESLLPKIFDRFVHGDGGKHGIGLALVKAIIDDHHGIVTAENNPTSKTGAIFTVYLPISDTNRRSI